MSASGCGIDLSGLHIGYASYGVSDFSCREAGVLGEPLTEGATLRWGHEAMVKLGNLLSPENKDSIKTTEESLSFMPIWSLWRVLNSNHHWNPLSKACDPRMVVQVIDQLLARHNTDSSWRALVVDDDLPFSLQEKFSQFIRVNGLNIVLLPRTVANFLAWADEIAPGEKRKWGGRSCVVVDLKVNELVATEIEMAWVDKNWRDKKGSNDSADGYLIPSIKKQSKIGRAHV